MGKKQSMRQQELDKWNAMTPKQQAQQAYLNPLSSYGTTCFCTGGHFPLATCPYAIYPDEITFTDENGNVEPLFDDD